MIDTLKNGVDRVADRVSGRRTLEQWLRPVVFGIVLATSSACNVELPGVSQSERPRLPEDFEVGNMDGGSDSFDEMDSVDSISGDVGSDSIDGVDGGADVDATSDLGTDASSCPAGTEDCNDDGVCETNILSDFKNCGGCRSVCVGTDNVCDNGTCGCKANVPITPSCGDGRCEDTTELTSCPQDCSVKHGTGGTNGEGYSCVDSYNGGVTVCSTELEPNKGPDAENCFFCENANPQFKPNSNNGVCDTDVLEDCEKNPYECGECNSCI